MIAFDVFGVLISEGHLISNGLMHLLSSGADKTLVKQSYEKYNVGAISESEFWKNIEQEGNYALRGKFLNLFQLDTDFAVIHQLKRDYRLAILSNFPADWATTLMDKFEFDALFDPIAFSGFVECRKPQPEIYKLLIKKSGLAANQIAFIDDRLENLQTAHDLGMTTIYYQRENDSHSYRPDMMIQNLKDIETLFSD